MRVLLSHTTLIYIAEMMIQRRDLRLCMSEYSQVDSNKVEINGYLCKFCLYVYNSFLTIKQILNIHSGIAK